MDKIRGDRQIRRVLEKKVKTSWTSISCMRNNKRRSDLLYDAPDIY